MSLDFDKIVNSSLKAVMEGNEEVEKEVEKIKSSVKNNSKETFEGELEMTDIDRACSFAEASAISAGLGALTLLRQLRNIEEGEKAKKFGKRVGLGAAAAAAGTAAYPFVKKGSAAVKEDLTKGVKAAGKGLSAARGKAEEIGGDIKRGAVTLGRKAANTFRREVAEN